jgi:hypothetical protein
MRRRRHRCSATGGRRRQQQLRGGHAAAHGVGRAAGAHVSMRRRPYWRPVGCIPGRVGGDSKPAPILGVVSSRRDKLHKRCQSPQPLGQAPEPRPDVRGAREAITPALHVVGGGELNQRPLFQQAAKRCAILLGNPGDRLDFASGEQSGFGFLRTLNVGFANGATMTGGAHAKE